MRLFEFGDLSWVPSWYHVNLRRYLIFLYRLFGYFRLWKPAIHEFIESSKSETFLELGSGGGEPLRMIVSELSPQLILGKRFVMSDINPVKDFVEQVNSTPESIFEYHSAPVDATNIPDYLEHPRIFINSFHHFSPDQVRECIESSMKAGQPVLILEYVRNSPLAYVSMLVGALVILLTLPFVVKPKQLPTMLIFTYLLPVFPLMVLWDGVVSCYRAYDPKSLEKILADNTRPFAITSYVQRSIMYPAGVTAIQITNKKEAS